MHPEQSNRQQRTRTWLWGRLLLALMASASLSLSSPARGAETYPVVETLRVGFTSAARNNLFKIGTWTPVWVQLKGGTSRFNGFLEVEVPDDDGTPTAFRQVIDVPPGNGTVRVVTYARPGSRDPNFTIRLYDDQGRRVGPTVDGSQLVQLSPVQADETLIFTLGKPAGVEQVPTLPGFAGEKANANATAQEVVVARVDETSGSLPARWYGYDSAANIVLDTNDKDVMTSLENVGQGLVDWVDRGGHLVVAVGGNWQSVRDSAIGPILPAVPTGQERLRELDSLIPFAGAIKPITPPGSPAVQVARLEQIESRGGKVLAAEATVPLVVRGTHGFGRVTLIAFDVDQKPFSNWPDRAQFWVKAMDLRRVSTEATNRMIRVSGGNPLYVSGVNDLSTQLRGALEQFPGVKLIPFGWVAFFIFLYILLIGPGDYLFLKKIVKRMELTWVTFPLIVLTVSLLAYVAAYMIKGKELRVNKLDVVDVDTASGMTRGSSFVNLFSPQNRDYGISFLPLPLDRAPEPTEPGGSPAASIRPDTQGGGRPPAGTEVLVTWLGVPEPGFGGMGGTGRIGFSGGGYASMPVGASERLEGVRIPIWSTKLLNARWYAPTSAASAIIDADLVPVGTDRLSGTVRNRLDVSLDDAILAFGKHVYLLGKVAPGATMRVELSQDRQLSGLLKSKVEYLTPGYDPSGARHRINRADLALALMFHDSQGASTADKQLPSNPLHYLDLTGQLALDRPMLVARMNRPAVRLVLENAPSPPKVDQTTMLRVILPLGKADAAD